MQANRTGVGGLKSVECAHDLGAASAHESRETKHFTTTQRERDVSVRRGAGQLLDCEDDFAGRCGDRREDLRELPAHHVCNEDAGVNSIAALVQTN